MGEDCRMEGEIQRSEPNRFDYSLRPSSPPPAGYPPEPDPDTFTSDPGESPGDWEERRQAFLDWVSRNPAQEHLSSVFRELARLEAGGPPHLALFEAALDFVDRRLDCADFVLHGILRLLYQFGGDPRLPGELLERARRTVLDFKYWPDEPGRDSMCTWTENHQILFAGAALLAGQLFPDQRFPTRARRAGRRSGSRAAGSCAGSSCAFAPASASGSPTSTTTRTWWRCSRWSTSPTTRRSASA